MDNKIGTITYSIVNEDNIIEVVSETTGEDIFVTVKYNDDDDLGRTMAMTDEQAAALGRALLTMVNGRT